MLSHNTTDNVKPIGNSEHHPVASRLQSIMHKKQTNLAVAADVRTKKELLDLIDLIGENICILKTHIDIIDDFDDDLIMQLLCKAKEYNFLICEDRKFADIGSTVQAQFVGGIYRIADWADIIIAHAVSGPGIIDALRKAKKEVAIFLVAQLSSKDNLISEEYTHRVVTWAEQNDDVVIGIIAQSAMPGAPHQFKCTPGVSLRATGDSLGQQYNTPAFAVKELLSDIIIVGRDIYGALNPKEAAQAYKDAAWTAFLERD